MSEQELIDLYWQRSDRAIDRTAQIFGAYCYDIAHHILHDRQDSEECCNDTWLRAWNSIPPQRPQRLRLWLGKITRNLAFDRYRAANAAKRGSGELPLVLDELRQCIGADSPEQILLTQELAACVRAFLDTLTPRQRGIFLLRYFYAEPVSRIAERFQLTPNHTTKILSRTRSKLRTRLEEEGYL